MSKFQISNRGCVFESLSTLACSSSSSDSSITRRRLAADIAVNDVGVSGQEQAKDTHKCKHKYRLAEGAFEPTHTYPAYTNYAP